MTIKITTWGPASEEEHQRIFRLCKTIINQLTDEFEGEEYKIEKMAFCLHCVKDSLEETFGVKSGIFNKEDKK